MCTLSNFSQWLEVRLKEYYAKRARRDSNWSFTHFSSFLPNQPPIEAVVFDFRVLELHLETIGNQDVNEKGDGDRGKSDAGGLLRVCWNMDNYPGCFEQGNSRVKLVYQIGSQGVGKELELHLYASEVRNELAASIPKYIVELDENQIDMYSRVFPLLKQWTRSRGVKIDFPIAECYYGSYENDRSTSNHSLVSVACLQESSCREEEKPLTRSRLLILEDLERQGFSPRNVGDTPFLSLRNVEMCLRNMATIHCTSWAFMRVTHRSLPSPCLLSPLHMSFIREQVVQGFLSMMKTVNSYMEARSWPNDKKCWILRHLIKLRSRLEEILDCTLSPPKVKCLIHQNADHPNFLFRYSIPPQPAEISEAMHIRKRWQTNQIVPQPKTICSMSKERLRREVRIVNWKTAAIGSPMIDVAQLLLTALPPKTRQEETGALLTVYWDTFRELATKFGLSFDWSEVELYKDYMECLLYTCVILTPNIGRLSELNCEEMDVFLSAIQDLISAQVM